MRLQNDLLSVRRAAAGGAARSPRERRRARSAAGCCSDWNAVESGDSPAAALFEVWWSRHLGPA
jgi:penicillin amidase